MANKKNKELTYEEVEVIELGEDLVFEILSTIEDDGNTYFVLTPFIENDWQIDPEVPAEVFVIQQITKEDNEEILEPVVDYTLVEKIFNKFRSETKDKFDFADKKNFYE